MSETNLEQLNRNKDILQKKLTEMENFRKPKNGKLMNLEERYVLVTETVMWISITVSKLIMKQSNIYNEEFSNIYYKSPKGFETDKNKELKEPIGILHGIYAAFNIIKHKDISVVLASFEEVDKLIGIPIVSYRWSELEDIEGTPYYHEYLAKQNVHETILIAVNYLTQVIENQLNRPRL